MNNHAIKKNTLNICLEYYVRPSGFEPETDGLENRCSIQLSYGRLSFSATKVAFWMSNTKYLFFFL